VDDEEEGERKFVSGHGSRRRVRKRRKDGWSKRDERVFLRHFRATCNATASARAAGKGPDGAFELRRRDAAFAASWDQALAEGRLRLHAKLIMFAETNGKPVAIGEDGEPGEPDPADFDADLALKLLRYHQDLTAGRGRRRARGPQVSDEELTAALLCQLDALKRRRARVRI